MSNVWILPSMTVQQVAEWCERNRMIVTIEWAIDKAGRTVPLVTAIEERQDPFLPAFLRKQAE
jgi:hypothetical protein